MTSQAGLGRPIGKNLGRQAKQDPRTRRAQASLSSDRFLVGAGLRVDHNGRLEVSLSPEQPFYIDGNGNLALRVTAGVGITQSDTGVAVQSLQPAGGVTPHGFAAFAGLNQSERNFYGGPPTLAVHSELPLRTTRRGRLGMKIPLDVKHGGTGGKTRKRALQNLLRRSLAPNSVLYWDGRDLVDIAPGNVGDVLEIVTAGGAPVYTPKFVVMPAPATAQYLVLAADGTLTAERVLTIGHGLDGTDAGAGNPFTLDVDETELDHGLIAGLGDDDHTIYLLATGARAMSGDLDMDGNDITGLASILGTNDLTILAFSAVAAAVNHVTLSNAATGTRPAIAATGTDANIGLRLLAKGSGEVWCGSGGTLAVVNGAGTSFPASSDVEGAPFYRTDLDERFFYEATRTKWLGESKEQFFFGHSAVGLAASTRLRTVGVGNDADSAYEIPYDMTIVGWSYARADSDASTIEIMVNAATVAVTINTSATRGSDTTVNVDVASGDELWARVGSGAANAMDLRTLVVWARRRTA